MTLYVCVCVCLLVSELQLILDTHTHMNEGGACPDWFCLWLDLEMCGGSGGGGCIDQVQLVYATQHERRRT